MPFNALLNQTLIHILFPQTVFRICSRQLYFRVLTTYREQRSKFSARTEENLNINFISSKGLKHRSLGLTHLEFRRGRSQNCPQLASRKISVKGIHRLSDFISFLHF